MWLTVALATVAVGLAVPTGPRLRQLPARTATAGPPWVLLLGGGAAAGVAVVHTPRIGALIGIGTFVAAGSAALVRRRRAAASARQEADRILETCDLLAGELAAGQPPGSALVRAAQAWPPLLPAAVGFDLGRPVPAELRRLADRSGASDLRLVAAAWEVSQRTGDGLADALRRCAASLRARRATRRVVEGELASARATARLVAGLPLLTWVMGTGAGGSPVWFLVGDPVGVACLAGGVGFGLLGLWWIEALAEGVESS